MSPDEPGYEQVLMGEVRLRMESDDEYRALRSEWLKHVVNCPQCNYDQDCIICVADTEKLNARHSCNCDKGDGEGAAIYARYKSRLSLLKAEAQKVVDLV